MLWLIQAACHATQDTCPFSGEAGWDAVAAPAAGASVRRYDEHVGTAQFWHQSKMRSGI